MTGVLEKICADKRIEVERRHARVPPAELERRIGSAPVPRGFAARLAARATTGTALIAEIKKASPSRGLVRADFDPATLARAYREGGATCLSVLTDGPYFQGDDTDLIAARQAVDLPVLRKDFTLDPYQVLEARALGADCVLLILAALVDTDAARLAAGARALGLDVLAEVHDEAEVERALRIDATLIGINNRDLKSLHVDLGVFERLAPRVPRDRLLVAESGIRTSGDIARLKQAGAAAFLVGESLMAQADVAAATRTLLAPARERVA